MICKTIVKFLFTIILFSGFILFVTSAQAQECLNPPVKIADSNDYYFTIQEAYDAAGNGSILQIRSLNFRENITAHSDISVSFKGGYDCDFANIIGNSIIEGNIYINNGLLEYENIVISYLIIDTHIITPGPDLTLSGLSYDITGTGVEGTDPLLNVQVSTDGGAGWSTAAGTTAWSYLWTLPAEDYVAHTIVAKAVDENAVEDLTPASVTIYVDTVAPGGLSNALPADGAIDQVVNSSVSLNSATDGSGSVEYFFEVAEDILFTTGVQQSGWQAGTGYAPVLTYGTTYYWHGKARDASGNETGYTATSSFSTRFVPQIENLNLDASSPDNLTTDDLMCSYTLSGTATTAATAWYRNSLPVMTLYMPFEGGLANAMFDYSGNVYNGIKGAGVTWNAAGGYDGNGAFEFDGSQYAEIDAGDIMPTGAYTKVGWVRRTGSGKNNIISGNSGHVLWAPDSYSYKLSAGHNGSWNIVQDSVSLALDTWYFVAVTYDPNVNSGEMVLYRDGVVVNSATAVPSQDLSDKKVWIGSYNGSFNFGGRIDEVRMYDHALTPEQIWALFNSGRDLIAFNETGVGEEWQAYVTPFSSTEKGVTYLSNVLTVQATVELDYIEIQGPVSVNENSSVDYDAMAYYTDGTNQPVEPDSWTVDCPLVADISATGLVTTYEVGVDEPCAITASYTEGGITRNDIYSITVLDQLLLSPQISNLILSASSPGNLTTDDLMCSYTLSGTATIAATAWYKNGLPVMTLYMPFEGGLANAMFDYSGNAYNGIKGAGVTWNEVGGYDGNGAFEFDGSQYAEIDAGDIMPTGAYTKVGWVRRTGSGKNNIISGNSGHVFWAPDSYSYKLSAGHNGSWNIVQDSVSLALDTWYFVAVTYDPNVNSGEMVLYRDGVVVNSATAVPSQDLSDKKVWIGSYNGSFNFGGRIDEVRMYDHALTPEQIWALFNSGRDLIAFNETGVGEEWQAYVTPFSSTEKGVTYLSNVLTVQATVELDYIEIQGPVSVNENSSVDYDAMAYYTDGTNQPVEPDSWTVDCPLVADISATGLVTTYEVGVDEPCAITASYTEGGITRNDIYSITVLDQLLLSPQISNLILSASSPGNLTTDDLMCSYTLSGTATIAATAWYKNGLPVMTLYMPFEGGLANAMFDYSGNAYNGIKGAGVTWNEVGGYDGNGAFEFDGSQYAEINVGDIMPTGAYTKVGWVRRTGSGKNNIISGNSGHVFWAPDSYSYKLSAGHNGSWNIVQDSVSLAIDTWYFVAVTYDPNVNSGEMVLYRDGVAVNSDSGVPSQDLSDKKVWIGSYNGSFNFGGSIDEVRMYDHALTPEQIWTLFNSGRDLIAFNETGVGEEWQAYVTPFSSTEKGSTYLSNVLTIQGSAMAPLDYIMIQGPVSVNENSSIDYDAMAYYTDGTNQLVEPGTWSVDCPLVADISATGLVTTYEVGVDEPCAITASYTEGGITRNDTYNITVTDVPVSNSTLDYIVIQGPVSVNENSSVDYDALAYYTDGTNQPIETDSWTVDCPLVADISATGLVTTYEVGVDEPCAITASYTEGGITRNDVYAVTILQEIKIMPLGNSITVGVMSSDGSGYRWYLDFLLSTAGYNFDFVGSQQDGPLDFDRDHEGHYGWQANAVRDNIYNWLVANPADVVLLHIGTEDISSGQDVSGIVSEVEQILNNIDQYESDYGSHITVFLARIINRSDPGSGNGILTTTYNDELFTMAQTRIAGGDSIVMVDQESALNYPDDMADNVYPNDIGYDKMSDTWFIAIDQLLSTPLISDLTLSASSPGNLTTDDLMCSYTLSGTAATSATAWYKNGLPMMTLYMPFEGGTTNSLFDYSGNAHNGIKGAGVTWNAAGGYDGSGAFEFDGSQNAEIDGGDIMPSGAYTKVGWVRRTGSGKNNIISGNSDHAFWAPDNYAYKLSAGHNGSWNIVQDSVSLALDTWYFVAVTYDPNVNSGELVLYKDGVVVDSAAGVPVHSVSDRKVWIGAYNGSFNFGGSIDEVRMYDHALSAGQIWVLFNSGRDLIVFSETGVGDEWQVYVTPFSATEKGSTYLSNVLTIQGSATAPLDYIVIQGPGSVNENSNIDYDAMAYYTDGTNQLVEPGTWSVDCPLVADISATGLVSTYEVGVDEPCAITASYTEGGITRNDTYNITVTDVPVSTSPLDYIEIQGPVSVNENSSVDYDAMAYYTDGTNQPVEPDSWTVDCPLVADISATGLVSTYEVGVDEPCAIIASYTEGGIMRNDTYNITVTDVPVSNSTLDYILIQGPVSVNENSSVDYDSMAYYTDGTSQPVEPGSWTVDCPLVADISATGLVTTYEVGVDEPCAITASYTEGGITRNDLYAVTILQEIKIMPLGNSITMGVMSSDGSGYRWYLDFLLSTAGYNFDLVGSQQDGPLDFDRDHEGHSGWQANAVRDNIYNWLVANPADIVLLHIGTNDISQRQDVSGIVSEVEQILNNIDQYESDYGSNITVFLARIINRSNPGSGRGIATTTYNDELSTMAQTRVASGDSIVIVDQESALIYPDDMADSVHPDDIGYDKMSDTWFISLDQFLTLQ